MIPIVKSPQYERDLTEIWLHVAQSNPVAADRVVMANC
jgi:plasmid stabilization system protein ParE